MRVLERDLVAVAAGEAGPAAAHGVERHVAICPRCRDELGRYRVLEGMVSDLRRAPMAGADPTLARAELESRLADIRSRMVTYGIFPSPLGRILIARSELGVSMVRYIDSDASARAHLARLAGDEVVEDEAAIEPVYRELLDYLNARETRLNWPLDLRWAGSDFQRRVLADRSQEAAALPRGRVSGRRCGQDRSRQYVRVDQPRQGVLRSELRLAVGDAACSADPVRLASARRGRRPEPVHELPARSAPSARLAFCLRLTRAFHTRPPPVS